MYKPTSQVVAKYTTDRVKTLLENASKRGASDVVRVCEDELACRALPKKLKIRKLGHMSIIGQVRGFHFVCPGEADVKHIEGRTWATGIWVVDMARAEAALGNHGYVALHRKKSEPSYRQGIIKGVRKLRRNPLKVDGQEVKAIYGIEFTFELQDKPLPWRGGGSGEKGYYYGEDEAHTV